MGKGDIRSRKGKITAGSFGISRMRKSNVAKPSVEATVETPKAAPKKTTVTKAKVKKK